jgi:hypothetical protein
MADAVVQVAPDSTGAKIDNESLTVGANTVMRQRTEIAGAAAAEIARVRNDPPGIADYGLVVRNIPAGTREPAAQTHVATGAATGVAAEDSGTIVLNISGTFVATVAFEGTADGTTWFAINGYKNDGSTVTQNTTGPGIWYFPAPFYRQIRTNCTAFTSGTVTVNWTAQPMNSFVSLLSPSGLIAATIASGTNDADGGNGVLATHAHLAGFNGNNWDRLRVNTEKSLLVSSPQHLFRGRASTFRIPGRAGTTGQKLMSVHNATGSAVTVVVNKVAIDLVQTVIKAVTVLPPVVRLWKVTVLPTNGTAMTKNRIGGSTTSSASVTVLNDASADGTNSGTALTATLPAGTFVTQEFAPRLITAAGYEMADRLEWLGDTQIELQALEGLVLFLDYTLATQNPTTDMWIASLEWFEY